MHWALMRYVDREGSRWGGIGQYGVEALGDLVLDNRRIANLDPREQLPISRGSFSYTFDWTSIARSLSHTLDSLRGIVCQGAGVRRLVGALKSKCSAAEQTSMRRPSTWKKRRTTRSRCSVSPPSKSSSTIDSAHTLTSLRVPKGIHTSSVQLFEFVASARGITLTTISCITFDLGLASVQL